MRRPTRRGMRWLRCGAVVSPRHFAHKYTNQGVVMTLTKAELADLLFEKVGLNKREAKDMVEAFFEEIRGALERGESGKMAGVGNFQTRDTAARPGRKP